MLNLPGMPLDWRQAFGRRVRARREALMLTRAGLYAAMGNRRSANTVYVGNLESGLSGTPTIKTVLKLAEALKCSLDWLLLGKGPA